MLVASTVHALQAPVSDGGQVPAPTGSYPVGRTAFHWVDSSRTDPFAASVSSRREVMVYVWYPARHSGRESEGAYFPHIDAIAQALGDSLMREAFGSAAVGVKIGQVRSHVIEHAELARSAAMSPVLVFSHGFGESGLTYSAQLADLASHGYVVFSIEHPHNAFAVWFPDGRVVPFAAALWDSARARRDGAVGYQLAQVPVRAADIRFVLDKIEWLNSAVVVGNLFAHRLDLGHIGAFGHSLGGVAAASACRTDARIAACANEDADDDGRPFDGGWAASPIKQPFLFMASGHSIYVSPRTPLPSAEALVRMKLTRVQYDSIVGLYQRNQDAALASLPGGAVRVMAESSDFTHRTFIDLKLLQATDAAADTQRHYVGLIRVALLAFFDKTLRGRADTPLDRDTPIDSIVTIQRFPGR